MGSTDQKGGAPPRYDEAFKAGAILMVTEQGPSREVANELGTCVDTLRNWLKAAGVQLSRRPDRIGISCVIGKCKRKSAPCESS